MGQRSKLQFCRKIGVSEQIAILNHNFANFQSHRTGVQRVLTQEQLY